MGTLVTAWVVNRIGGGRRFGMGQNHRGSGDGRPQRGPGAEPR